MGVEALEKSKLDKKPKTVDKEGNSDFKNKVKSFFKERHIGEIVELNPASLNRYYIKFKPFSSVWFQQFSDSVEVDSVDFERNTISGFINSASEFKL